MISATSSERSRRKKCWVRRSSADRSQLLRRAMQGLFLALNVWIGFQFYFFVRYYESGGEGWKVPRPPGVEGWLPIASLMNLKAFLVTGRVPAVHPAGMFLLMAFLGVSILFRKAFCSWLCPVGTVSEYFGKLGRSIFRRSFTPPFWADIPLRGVKYALMGLFVYVTLTMSVSNIRAFLEGPYGLIADVKMLNFFRFLSPTAAVVLGALAVASLLVPNVWCRYFCPYGAWLGLGALFSPARIRREPEACIDCGKCAKACPSRIPVDRLIAVRSAECTGCLECVAICPAERALFMSLPGKRRLPPWAMAAGIALVILGVVGFARYTGNWHTELPERVYQELIPRAQEFSHP